MIHPGAVWAAAERVTKPWKWQGSGAKGVFLSIHPVNEICDGWTWRINKWLLQGWCHCQGFSLFWGLCAGWDPGGKGWTEGMNTEKVPSSSHPRKQEKSNDLIKVKRVKTELNSAGHICMTVSVLQFPWSQMEVHRFLAAELGTASTSVLLGVPAHPVLQLQLPYGCSLTETTHFFYILAFYPQYLIHSTSWVRLHSLCLFLGVCFSVYLYVLSQWRPRAGTESNAAFPWGDLHWF